MKNLEKYKLVILAGGYGTRLGRFTKIKPKPMVDIGGVPIIIHIVNIYRKFGIKKFIICLGFKGEIIKNYFIKKYKKFKIFTKKNITILKSESIEFYLLNTGINTMTGGRIKKVKNLVKNENFFYLTYGDGLADININELIKFHKKKKKLATVTIVKPQARFGSVKVNNKNEVISFKEKILDYINLMSMELPTLKRIKLMRLYRYLRRKSTAYTPNVRYTEKALKKLGSESGYLILQLSQLETILRNSQPDYDG